MIERLFVKNYRNISDQKVRTGYAIVAGAYGIVTNFLLGALKVVVGILSNSISIMADAVNNISDCASSVLTIIGFSMAARKPDSEHPYGHARFEYLSGFIIGLLMLLTGVHLCVESVMKIIRPEEVTFGVFSFVTLAFSILVKLSQRRMYGRYGRIIESNALKASSEDSRNDVIASVGLLASMAVMVIFKVNIDGLVGLVVSIILVIDSIRTIKEQSAPLIGIKPSKDMVGMITTTILSRPGVLGIHDLVIHNYGVHNDFVTVHVEIDSKRSFLEAHAIADSIEEHFRENLGINLTIHTDPVVLDNPKLENIRTQVATALAQFDPSVSFHDMRMVETPLVTKVVLDCVFPPEKGYSGHQIASILYEKVKMDCNLIFVVEVDIPFS